MKLLAPILFCVLLTSCEPIVRPIAVIECAKFGAEIFQYKGAEYLSTQSYLELYVRCRYEFRRNVEVTGNNPTCAD